MPLCYLLNLHSTGFAVGPALTVALRVDQPESYSARSGSCIRASCLDQKGVGLHFSAWGGVCHSAPSVANVFTTQTDIFVLGCDTQWNIMRLCQVKLRAVKPAPHPLFFFFFAEFHFFWLFLSKFQNVYVSRGVNRLMVLWFSCNSVEENPNRGIFNDRCPELLKDLGYWVCLVCAARLTPIQKTFQVGTISGK